MNKTKLEANACRCATTPAHLTVLKKIMCFGSLLLLLVDCCRELVQSSSKPCLCIRYKLLQCSCPCATGGRCDLIIGNTAAMLHAVSSSVTATAIVFLHIVM
jgi:hypothetical protein